MKFDRRLTRKARVDMTPLVDILFMLLLFFMMTSVFKIVPGLSLDLPTSTTASTVALTPFRVVAVSSDEIYVNDLRTNLAGLDAAIKRQMAGKKAADIQAVFQGDNGLPYQLVVSVLDGLRLNGIDGVSLLTSTPEGKK